MALADKAGLETVKEFFDRLNALLAEDIEFWFLGKLVLRIHWAKPQK